MGFEVNDGPCKYFCGASRSRSRSSDHMAPIRPSSKRQFSACIIIQNIRFLCSMDILAAGVATDILDRFLSFEMLIKIHLLF